jgi:hypothetical protein
VGRTFPDETGLFDETPKLFEQNRPADADGALVANGQSSDVEASAIVAEVVAGESLAVVFEVVNQIVEVARN